ncbi:MAG: MotA/TolQ/ExbB proton channel family protein [Phycisphaerales bacterium]
MTRHPRSITLLLLTLVGVVALILGAPGAAAQDDAPATGDVAGAVEEAPEGRSVSFAEAFFVQRNQRTGSVEWLGSAIIWLLLAMSVATFALISVFSRENARERIAPIDSISSARKRMKEGDHDAVEPGLKGDASYFAHALRAALRERDAGRDAMLRALEQACEELTGERMRRVETLNIIGSVSPMIGLFGTVYGMILAFREIVAAGGSPDPVGLAAGIGTALTTTFWGLVVAIPALAGYAFIRNTIDARVSEAALNAEDIVNHIGRASS